MSRLEIISHRETEETVAQLFRSMQRRIAANPPGLCPVDMTMSFLDMCRSQTCGKCSPCRVGLTQISALIREILDGDPPEDVLERIENTARTIVDTADCAIGIVSAKMVLRSLNAFGDDYREHIFYGRCLGSLKTPVPCVAMCPAGVDVPGYVALVREGRFDEAVQLIRKDNPLPVSCAYICEHPCESHCRRGMVDNPVNIRALKRVAVDNAGSVPPPPCAAPTGKKVAVVGGGPGGLSAAYFLTQMGHSVTIYESRNQLGGMMRYGIPSYRFPRELLDAEIRDILSLGVQVHTGVNVGKDISFATLKKEYDCLYLSIGAHTDKKVGIPGEESRGVMSAVEMLRRVGDGETLDFTGKEIVVIGGGNVAMDVTRSSIRFGARKVTCVYRRRQADMTAQAEEVEGAVAEGAELMTLAAPVRIEADESGTATALWVRPQIIGEIDRAGRPRPNNAAVDEVRIPADLVIVAIGQGIESLDLEENGIQIKRGGTLLAGSNTRLPDLDGVFAGGDCVTGPATVIRAIAAGKVAAANIDEYLGFRHEIHSDVSVPTPRFADLKPQGRVISRERPACERKNDFACIEYCFTPEEAQQESSRCLRCDHFGYGVFKGGRVEKW